MTPKRKTLYAFRFTSGGYNQVYAYTKRQAIRQAVKEKIANSKKGGAR